MNERQILVAIKEPGKEAYIEPLFTNDLKAFQEKVSGHIETVTLASELVLICNEEGVLKELPYNTTVCGYNFFGTIIAVGVRGDDFASIKYSVVPTVMKMLNGEKL